MTCRPTRIICVGNRYLSSDDLGPRVYDLLADRAISDGVELIDGGLHGLDLLRLVDGTRRIVFVDAVEGFSEPGAIVTLPCRTVAALAEGAWGHGAGLPHLFRLLPLTCEGDIPEVVLVGTELPAPSTVVAEVADRALAEAMR